MLKYCMLLSSLIIVIITGFVLNDTGDGLYLIPAFLVCHAALMSLIPSEGSYNV